MQNHKKFQSSQKLSSTESKQLLKYKQKKNNICKEASWKKWGHLNWLNLRLEELESLKMTSKGHLTNNTLKWLLLVFHKKEKLKRYWQRQWTCLMKTMMMLKRWTNLFFRQRLLTFEICSLRKTNNLRKNGLKSKRSSILWWKLKG